MTMRDSRQQSDLKSDDGMAFHNYFRDEDAVFIDDFQFSQGHMGELGISDGLEEVLHFVK